ncbi:DNA polymerase epsilon subunit 2 [Strongyloides ratti]|uniref:DNA polymerase II subunit 2 n=1 Tax=Strongyloides ratti TaxID=34506 RepID=A0A090MY85_STRRB|nr:DNA polymerase epsilon subunit 2 [Strongyloides ratti]CEF66744.1 DNA polymerase epsilon subunit 2 [Strongyloides ratti]
MGVVDEGTRRLIRNELKDAMDTYHMCYNVQVTNFLTDLFTSYDKVKIRSYVDKIAVAMRSGCVDVKALSLESLKVILTHLSTAKDDRLKVINVFKDQYKDGEETPKKKSFIPTEEEICGIQTTRLLTIKRLMDDRRNTIVNKIPGQLKNIQTLYGYAKLDYLVSIIGCAFVDSKNKYKIEDYESMIRMNLSKNCEYGDGILSIGTPLMFTGYYADGVINVIKIELPPLINVPKEVINNKINNGDTLKSIHQLLSGFSQSPPKCLVLMGNFIKSPLSTGSFEEYSDGFRRLGNIFKDIISLYPIWKDVKYVVVPGDQDIPSSVIYPKLPIPQFLQKYFIEGLDITFTSNPTIITNKGQRILVCGSNNVIEKMCRDAFHIPHDVTKISDQFVETIIRMRHIQPLPNYISLISPAYDDLFSLENLPDMIVLGDRFKSYRSTVGDCLVANPGQFTKANGFEFLVYYPHDKICEYSAIDMALE